MIEDINKIKDDLAYKYTDEQCVALYYCCQYWYLIMKKFSQTTRLLLIQEDFQNLNFNSCLKEMIKNFTAENKSKFYTNIDNILKTINTTNFYIQYPNLCDAFIQNFYQEINEIYTSKQIKQQIADDDIIHVKDEIDKYRLYGCETNNNHFIQYRGINIENRQIEFQELREFVNNQIIKYDSKIYKCKIIIKKFFQNNYTTIKYATLIVSIILIVATCIFYLIKLIKKQKKH